MEFSRQEYWSEKNKNKEKKWIKKKKKEYWSGLPFPSPGDLPDPAVEPWSPALQADSLASEPPGQPCYSQNKPQIVYSEN